MSEGHDHAHGDHEHRSAAASRRRLIIALALTASFMVAEIIAGFLSGSLALLSDAGHMLTDAGALGLAIWAQSLATRARSGQKTFGYRRAEILAAAANGIVLGVAAIAVVVEAIARLRSKPSVEGGPMLAVAVGGLVVNLISAWVLSRDEGPNLNMRAAAAHVLADAAGSVAAIVAAVLILTLGWTLADPITSILISVLILGGSWRLLRDATNVLMEGTPAAIDVAALERGVGQVPGVVGVHDLHVWSIAGDTPVVTVHVVIGEGRHGVDVARVVAEWIGGAVSKAHVTVQPEAPSPGDVLLPPKSLVRS
jgi:cobalt-zinc-cadmium efflux system protein